jgi:hypothetical protein
VRHAVFTFEYKRSTIGGRSVVRSFGCGTVYVQSTVITCVDNHQSDFSHNTVSQLLFSFALCVCANAMCSIRSRSAQKKDTLVLLPCVTTCDPDRASGKAHFVAILPTPQDAQLGPHARFEAPVASREVLCDPGGL